MLRPDGVHGKQSPGRLCALLEVTQAAPGRCRATIVPEEPHTLQKGTTTPGVKMHGEKEIFTFLKDY